MTPFRTVWPLFWAFRIMVALGFGFIAVMAYFFWRLASRAEAIPAGRCDWRWRSSRRRGSPRSWAGSSPSSAASPGPWTACCRRPCRSRHLSSTDLLITLAGFVTFYTVLFIVEMGLMLKYIRKGPYLDVELKPKPGRRGTNTGCAPMMAQGPTPCGHASGVRPMILYELIDYEILRVIWWLCSACC
jgi:cytochrome d ubiquinol oxidase subunit I